jgi:hypothetical protein
MTAIEERDKIVRWLREAANPSDPNNNINRVLSYLATAIERGDHLLDEDDGDDLNNVVFLELVKNQSGPVATATPALRQGGAQSE